MSWLIHLRKRRKRELLFLICVISFSIGGHGLLAQNGEDKSIQERKSRFVPSQIHDTSYVQNFSDKLSVKLIAVSKYNYFRLLDRETGTTIRYRPLRDVGIGAGASYRWIGLAITFNLGLRNSGEIEDYKSFDFQGKAFTNKQILSATYKHYKGYKIFGTQGFRSELVDDASTIREDIITRNIGFQYLHALNYEKFSLNAPFVLNEVQRKSAGSVILGASIFYQSMNADSSVIPPQVADFFNPDLYLTNMQIFTGAVNAGYMYSFVVKKRFFLTLSAIPGVGFNTGNFDATERNQLPPKFNFNLVSMNAIGYNSDRFFVGLQLIINSNYLKLGKKTGTEMGFGKGGLFVGYRFGQD